MESKDKSLPQASLEMESHVKEVFPTEMNPELFAAQDGVGWLDFTFNDYRFRDTTLDRWIHAVGSIVRDPEQLANCQKKYLSESELAEVRKYMVDDLEEEDES